MAWKCVQLNYELQAAKMECHFYRWSWYQATWGTSKLADFSYPLSLPVFKLHFQTTLTNLVLEWLSCVNFSPYPGGTYFFMSEWRRDAIFNCEDIGQSSTISEWRSVALRTSATSYFSPPSLLQGVQNNIDRNRQKTQRDNKCVW